MKSMLIFLLLLPSLGTLIQGGGQNAKQKWQWPRATAVEQNLDAKRLDQLVQLIAKGKEFPNLHSLLILRNGKLVVEEYFGRYQNSMRHTLQSVSKSFTSALVGIALQKKHFKRVEEKVLHFFPGIKDIKNMDKKKQAMRLKDLLTMRSGTDYNEGYSSSPHSKLNRLATGWDRFYLNRPMVREPGTHFQYDSGGVILISSLLKQRTGKHADSYALTYLFKPLQIEDIYWFRNSEGHPHMGGGLHLKPVDMAKFGQLYLQQGKWQGKRVIASQWVEESFKMYVNLGNRSPHVKGYGYLWWILEPDPRGSKKDFIYAAMGFRAQYIFVIPEYRMVVVVTGGTQSGIEQRKPIQFLYTHILPAIKRN